MAAERLWSRETNLSHWRLPCFMCLFAVWRYFACLCVNELICFKVGVICAAVKRNTQREKKVAWCRKKCTQVEWVRKERENLAQFNVCVCALCVLWAACAVLCFVLCALCCLLCWPRLELCRNFAPSAHIAAAAAAACVAHSVDWVWRQQQQLRNEPASKKWNDQRRPRRRRRPRRAIK